MDVRHDLDQNLVAAAIERKVAWLEAKSIEARNQARQAEALYCAGLRDGTDVRWPSFNEKPHEVEGMYDRAIRLERDLYSTVRVMEAPGAEEPFSLVYGGGDQPVVMGRTFRFCHLDQAAEWFLAGGR